VTSHEPLPADLLQLQPVRSVATAASALIGLSCVTSAIDCWANWHAYHVVEDYVAGTPGVGVADLVAADNVRWGAGLTYALAYLAAAVVFLVWLWRARRNAEDLSPDGHRLGRGWTIGGWLVPVVSFWFPLRIVEDIWHASRPADVVAPSAPVRRWWFMWIATTVAAIWLRFASRGEPSIGKLAEIAIVNTVTTVLQCAAGALVFLVIRQITRWQSIPRWA
jgi:Domain of unknown function (DUF4328)